MGTVENLAEIDRIIAAYSKDWQLDRLARVDRNIMRLAVYEILYREDIPAGVSVNEAVELAKIFGGEDSGRFVNGILGRVVTMPGVAEAQAQADTEKEGLQRTEV
jgi:transcription antitermination factor NusB